MFSKCLYFPLKILNFLLSRGYVGKVTSLFHFHSFMPILFLCRTLLPFWYVTDLFQCCWISVWRTYITGHVHFLFCMLWVSYWLGLSVILVTTDPRGCSNCLSYLHALALVGACRLPDTEEEISGTNVYEKLSGHH